MTQMTTGRVCNSFGRCLIRSWWMVDYLDKLILIRVGCWVERAYETEERLLILFA